MTMSFTESDRDAAVKGQCSNTILAHFHKEDKVIKEVLASVLVEELGFGGLSFQDFPSASSDINCNGRLQSFRPSASESGDHDDGDGEVVANAHAPEARVTEKESVGLFVMSSPSRWESNMPVQRFQSACKQLIVVLFVHGQSPRPVRGANKYFPADTVIVQLAQQDRRLAKRFSETQHSLQRLKSLLLPSFGHLQLSEIAVTVPQSVTAPINELVAAIAAATGTTLINDSASKAMDLAGNMTASSSALKSLVEGASTAITAVVKASLGLAPVVARIAAAHCETFQSGKDSPSRNSAEADAAAAKAIKFALLSCTEVIDKAVALVCTTVWEKVVFEGECYRRLKDLREDVTAFCGYALAVVQSDVGLPICAESPRRPDNCCRSWTNTTCLSPSTTAPPAVFKRETLSTTKATAANAVPASNLVPTTRDPDHSDNGHRLDHMHTAGSRIEISTLAVNPLETEKGGLPIGGGHGPGSKIFNDENPINFTKSCSSGVCNQNSEAVERPGWDHADSGRLLKHHASDGRRDYDDDSAIASSASSVAGDENHRSPIIKKASPQADTQKASSGFGSLMRSFRFGSGIAFTWEFKFGKNT